MKKYTVFFMIHKNKPKSKSKEFELEIKEIDENKTQYATMTYEDYTRLIERNLWNDKSNRTELEDPIYMTK